MMAKSEPIDFNQVINNSNWLVTMQEELRAFERNKNWELMGQIKQETN